MGTLLRLLDWSITAVGAVETWLHLKTAIRMIRKQYPSK